MTSTIALIEPPVTVMSIYREIKKADSNSHADIAKRLHAFYICPLLTTLLQRCEKAEAALQEFMDITDPAAQPAIVDPDYGVEVMALGERIGYGALMASASASWRDSARRRGYPDGAEFVVGPCMSVLLATRRAARNAMGEPE